LLLAFGLFAMFLAGPFILVQTNLKRMLAYSSLEHVGLICAGIGMNSPLTIFGALLHMGYHAMTKPVLFFASGNIHQRFHTLEMRRIGPGLAKSMPATALLLGLAGVAVIGLPPFGLFASELIVIGGGFAAHRAVVSALVLAALVVVFCGFLKQIARLLLGTPRPAAPGPTAAQAGVAAMSLPLGALLVFSVWLPGPVCRLLQQASQIVGGAP
jgi:hydrogenase-4 component F